MSSKTLLSKTDAKRFSELGEAFPSCDLTDIFQVELTEFRKCLGIEFYEKLKSSLADYSDTPQWVTGSNIEGNTVKNRGTIWTAKTTTASEPIAENEYWGLAPKFDISTDCGAAYNDFYCLFLGRYLALSVVLQTGGRSAVNLNASGITVKHGDGYAPADSKQRQFFFESIRSQIANTLENMRFWVNNHASKSCFSDSLLIENGDGCGCGTAQNRDCKPFKTGWVVC